LFFDGRRLFCCGVKIQSQRTDDLQNGRKLWIAVRGECFVKTFAAETGFIGERESVAGGRGSDLNRL
jgi:hypothetical protein